MEALAIYGLIGLIVFVYPMFELAFEVYRGTHGQRPRGLELVCCIIPLVNSVMIIKWLGANSVIVSMLYLVGVVAIGFRVLVFIGLIRVPILMIASVYAVLGGIAIIWFTTSYVVFTVCQCVGSKILSKLFSLILPTVGAFIISNTVRVPLNKVRTELR